MKISIDSVAAKYRNTTPADTKGIKSVPVKDTGRNFDQIMIHTNSKQMAEARITEAAEKKIQNSVFQQTPDEKIDSLQKQVADGTYRVDAEALAARILLMGGNRG